MYIHICILACKYTYWHSICISISKNSYIEDPDIVQAPQDVLQLQKPDVKFICTANGYPAPDITWNFTNLSNVITVFNSTNTSSDRNSTTAELDLINVTANEFGNYSCVAFNGFGDDSAVAMLQSGKLEYASVLLPQCPSSNLLLSNYLILFTIM